MKKREKAKGQVLAQPKLNMVKEKISTGKSKSDLIFLLLTCALVIFGLVMVYSSSYYLSINEHGHPNHYIIRQAVFAALGFVSMFFFSRIDYHIWIKLWPFIYGIGFALLVAVLLVGASANGGQRWISIGGFTLMPGEMAKTAMVITVVGFFSIDPRRADNWKWGIFPIIALAGLYAGLIMLQPNMSTAFTIIFIVAGMMFVAGTKFSKLLILAGVAVIGGVGLIFSDTTGYRWARVQSMLDPFKDELGSGYQVVQSLLALGKGGLTGLGLGNSVQKTLYLPFPQNDFILSVIGEELGYVGILALMIVYVLLIWRGLKIAINANDYEGLLLTSGIIITIAVQVLMNIAVVTSFFMPPTGVVLPFISYGGTAMLVFMSMIGMILNVSRQENV